MKRDTTSMFTVTDQQLIDCMKFYAQTMKIVVEPTGCLSLAALRTCGIDLKGKKVGVIVSGGNVDLDKYAKWLSS
jgi:threo-3-hydroxy-L-aspartate ammonia-lyase